MTSAVPPLSVITLVVILAVMLVACSSNVLYAVPSTGDQCTVGLLSVDGPLGDAVCPGSALPAAVLDLDEADITLRNSCCCTSRLVFRCASWTLPVTHAVRCSDVHIGFDSSLDSSSEEESLGGTGLPPSL